MRTPEPYPSRSAQSGRLRRMVAAVVVIAVAASSLSFSAPPAVVVTRLSDLGFGDVATNAMKQIHYSDPGAASFRIEATGFVAQTGFSLDLTLPMLLSSGGDTVPVSFSSTDAAWSYGDNIGSATVFDPNTGTSVAKNGANFIVYVWIGGRITTDGGTTQDVYTSSLTIDIATE